MLMQANVAIDHEFRTYNLTAPVLGSFLNLFEAKAITKGGRTVGEPKYSIDLEFPEDHPDLGPIKARMMQIAKLHWPGRDIAGEFKTVDANGNRKMQTFVFPLKSGNQEADKAKLKQPPKEREWSRGRTIITSRTTKEPQLSVIANGQLIDLTAENRAAHKGKFFSGVEVLAQLYLKPYEGATDNDADGVTAYLNMVVSTGKGTKLTGGRVSASETFKGYIGNVSAEDPTLGMDLDDEIPF